MKIVELKINDSAISGLDAVALVETPAIEEDFLAFNKVNMAEMTYNDYPQAAVDAAKRGIELNKENNMKCATQVGKVRAQQLVNRENLSLDTIKRMRSFLIRQKSNYELATSRKDYNACGYISYLLWGGEAALPWAEKKLRQAGIEFSEFSKEGQDVYLISCSSEKLDTKSPAYKLYDSPLFKKSLSFAQKQQQDDDYIKILSAKYYLTDLDKVIEPYDLTLNNFSSQQKKDWANKVYSQMLDKFSLQFDRFMFLAGNDYTEYLMSKFKYKTDVLEGMRIGERMAYLDKFYIVTNNDSYATKHNFSLLSSNIPQMPPNEPQLFDLDKACQPGYKALGVKEKNGRIVPNCIPIENFNEELINYIISDVLGLDEEDFAVGVPHYTKEGKLYEGPTHTDANGRLMTGEVHTDDSVYLYHIEELLEIFGINVAGLPNFINEASTGGRKKDYFAALTEKQMLIGPLMTPSKLIPRIDKKTGEEYQVYFTKETIERIAYKMMQDKLLDSVNIEHDGARKINGVYLVETWIVKDPEKDKSLLYGFKPVEGQWFGIYKVGDGRVWNEYVKTGKVKGFSVEGYFLNNVLTTK
jgi:hypothetical protein